MQNWTDFCYSIHTFIKYMNKTTESSKTVMSKCSNLLWTWVLMSKIPPWVIRPQVSNMVLSPELAYMWLHSCRYYHRCIRCWCSHLSHNRVRCTETSARSSAAAARQRFVTPLLPINTLRLSEASRVHVCVCVFLIPPFSSSSVFYLCFLMAL